MSKGIRTILADSERAMIVTDYCAGLGINALRKKYRCGQARIIEILDAANVQRLTNPYMAALKRGKPRRDLIELSPGLGRLPSDTEWGYLAGIFDGEGYLGYASRGSYYRLAIAQKADTKLLTWLQETLRAGRISRQQGYKNGDIGQYHLESQRQIFEFCCGVLPYVMVKRVRVMEFITACQAKYGLEVPRQSELTSVSQLTQLTSALLDDDVS